MSTPLPLTDVSVNPSKVRELCEKYKLPYGLVRAIIQQESGNNMYAMRSEPSYRYLWDTHKGRPFRSMSYSESTAALPPIDFRAVTGSRLTEWQGQRASWGPMQIMGAVARELSYKGFLPALAGPLGLEYGIMFLRRLWDRFHAAHGVEGVIAAYNAGSPRRASGTRQYVNQDYVDSVLAHCKKFGD